MTTNVIKIVNTALGRARRERAVVEAYQLGTRHGYRRGYAAAQAQSTQEGERECQ